jgi:hypothetical protein
VSLSLNVLCPCWICVCVCVCVCVQELHPHSFLLFALWEYVQCQWVLKAIHPGRALLGAAILHAVKPHRLYPRKIGIAASQSWSKSCTEEQVMRCAGCAALCDTNALS